MKLVKQVDFEADVMEMKLRPVYNLLADNIWDSIYRTTYFPIYVPIVEHIRTLCPHNYPSTTKVEMS